MLILIAQKETMLAADTLAHLDTLLIRMSCCLFLLIRAVLILMACYNNYVIFYYFGNGCRNDGLNLHHEDMTSGLNLFTFKHN